MTTLTHPITPGQLKQITRMLGDIAESKEVQDLLSSLDKDSAERLKGSELASVVRQFVLEKVTELSTTNQFADEEMSSSYKYLSGYKKPKDITAQCNKLRELFSGVGYCNHDYQAKIEKGEVVLPENTEGWFAIPNWMKSPDAFGKTYTEAVLKVLDALNKTRNGKFYNYRAGQIDEQHLRQSERSKKFFADLAEAQGNPDILLVPAQFGIRHRGRSVRRARAVFLANEFGLGAFAVGIMLLTHPERLNDYNDLWIDCAGDEFDDPYSDVRFDQAPYFNFSGDEVRFDTVDVDGAYGRYGSSSGFVPQ